MSGLVWSDDEIGLSVWVNGSSVELTMGDGWSGRLTAEQAARIDAGGFADAIRVACARATEGVAVP
ncbi:hypothetical protein [Gordonia westfalica]|uniref:hypothetical protein n=1 Tax=Gordonia westfalica TaxID=158898 RepID=UPI000945A8F7|nr:hypothetical protein [Gordonia westfalica]